MPITEISFGQEDKDSPEPGGEDVHVLRGQSTLGNRDRLWVLDAGDNHWRTFDTYRTNHNDVDVEFRPVFRAAGPGNEFVGFGIRVNKTTGEVIVAGGAPPNFAPANFLLEAVVTRNAGGIPHDTIAPAVLRVHIHGGVNSIRLTPETLTVRDPGGARPSNTRYAFAVRAVFDDGTVGDVTFSHELDRFDPQMHFRLDGANHARRIVIRANTAIPQRVPVTVTTSADWGNRQARGFIDFRAGWAATPNLPAAEWIDGNPRVLDGTVPAEHFPNVLLLAAGCADANRNAFMRFATDLVHRLRVDPLLQPYGHLAGSMNFWRLALPGQPGGISVRGDVLPFTRGGQLFAKPIDAPVRPPASGEWELKHLMYMAGMPVAADIRLVRNKATNQPLQTLEQVRALRSNQIAFGGLEQKWNAMMRPTPARNVSPRLMRQWLLLVGRTLIDEVDTFPAVAIGMGPAAGFAGVRSLALHDLRGGIDECRAFLQNVSAAPLRGRPAITLGNGVVAAGAPSTAVGNLWGSELDNAATYDNRQLLTMLCHTPHGRARRSRDTALFFRLYAAPPGPAHDREDHELPGIPVVANATGDGLAFAPLDPALVMLSDTWRTFAHELAHAFGLGDEYVDHPTVFRGSENNLANHANLSTITSITGAGGALLVGNIKWNWHRVLFATIVTNDIVDLSNGRFEVPVLPVPNFRIARQNLVFLRQRDPQVVISRDTVTAGPFVVESVSAANDRVTIRLLAGQADPDDFSPQSIIYMPVPGQSSGTFARMVSPAAARIMQVAIGGTMTGKICKTFEQAAQDGDFTQVPVASDPADRVPKKELPGLVGAYFGGRQHACGIVHPTGQCMMRDHHDAATSFCPVCQYVLVEQIDPVRHAIIDREYAKRYRT